MTRNKGRRKINKTLTSLMTITRDKGAGESGWGKCTTKQGENTGEN